MVVYLILINKETKEPYLAEGELIGGAIFNVGIRVDNTELLYFSESKELRDYEYNKYLLQKSKTPEDIKNKQIGGDHYSGLKISPLKYAEANGLSAGEFSVIKYISRYKRKNGKEDLLKARHFIDLLIELNYPESAH